MGGSVLIYLPCWPFSLKSFLLFLPKIKGGGEGARSPGPSPRSATGIYVNVDQTKCILK